MRAPEEGSYQRLFVRPEANKQKEKQKNAGPLKPDQSNPLVIRYDLQTGLTLFYPTCVLLVVRRGS